MYIYKKVVHGKGIQQDVRLQKLLKRPAKYNIIFCSEKCKFCQELVVWFGNIYTVEETSPDPAKVEMIKQWPKPEDKSAGKSFLQTVQFNSTFMWPSGDKTYLDVTCPLKELTKHYVNFTRTKNVSRASMNSNHCWWS